MFALARVFGNIPEDLFSRSDEQAIFRAVAKAGLGPKLLVCFACCMTTTIHGTTMHCIFAMLTVAFGPDAHMHVSTLTLEGCSQAVSPCRRRRRITSKAA